MSNKDRIEALERKVTMLQAMVRPLLAKATQPGNKDTRRMLRDLRKDKNELETRVARVDRVNAHLKELLKKWLPTDPFEVSVTRPDVGAVTVCIGCGAEKMAGSTVEYGHLLTCSWATAHAFMKEVK